MNKNSTILALLVLAIIATILAYHLDNNPILYLVALLNLAFAFEVKNN